MLRFLTVDELYARKGGEQRVLGLAGGSGEAVQQAIEGAEGDAVAILSPRYGDALPTSPETTPAVLKDKVADLALYRITGGHDQVNPRLLADSDQAMTFLRLVGRNGADLGLSTRPTVDASGPGILTTHTAADARLSFTTLEDW